VAILADSAHRLIETKGREDTDVVHKDRAARLWCENASLLTGTPRGYLKMLQVQFEKLQPTLFADLGVLTH
jgi:type III restriction enzyme